MDEIYHWTEKYRAKSLDDLYLLDHILKIAESIIKDFQCINLLLTGDPGCGKTTLVMIILRILFGDKIDKYVLAMNASDERGIESIRDKVSTFVKLTIPDDVPFKVVWLDEADFMTNEAQTALRMEMEASVKCVFILSCNNFDMIIEPVRSRCAHLFFCPLTREMMEWKIDQICEAEGLKLNRDIRDLFIKHVGGDARKLTIMLQNVLYCGELCAPNVAQSSCNSLCDGKVDVDMDLVVKFYGITTEKEMEKWYRVMMGDDRFYVKAREIVDHQVNIGLFIEYVCLKVVEGKEFRSECKTDLIGKCFECLDLIQGHCNLGMCLIYLFNHLRNGIKK